VLRQPGLIVAGQIIAAASQLGLDGVLVIRLPGDVGGGQRSVAAGGGVMDTADADNHLAVVVEYRDPAAGDVLVKAAFHFVGHDNA